MYSQNTHPLLKAKLQVRLTPFPLQKARTKQTFLGMKHRITYFETKNAYKLKDKTTLNDLKLLKTASVLCNRSNFTCGNGHRATSIHDMTKRIGWQTLFHAL